MVVVDVKPPVLNGWGLFRLIRKRTIDSHRVVGSVGGMEIKLNDANKTVLSNEMIIELDVSGVMMDISCSDGCNKMFNGDITINKGFTDGAGKSLGLTLRYESLVGFTDDLNTLYGESLY
tara:strand:+ start:156 stop:515 length:360 start_codon:yes stop_codon:yes gene_type:complete